MFNKSELYKLLIGVIGSGGFITICYKFWLKPLADYGKLKSKIDHDLHYYANAVEVPNHDCPLRDKAIEKQTIFRENAANMTSITNSLPFWYKAWLKYNFEKPKESISPLQFISNANYDGCAIEVEKRYNEVKKALLLE